MTKKRMLGCPRVPPVEYHWSREHCIFAFFSYVTSAVGFTAFLYSCANYNFLMLTIPYAFKLEECMYQYCVYSLIPNEK
jgi:hypothetical protein